MAGLAEYFLGASNPFAQFVASNRNAIRGIGAGLATGRDFSEGLGYGARYAAEGAQMDDAYATQQKAEAERQAQLNRTVEFLQQNHPDLAGMVSNGMPVNEAWGEALRRMSPAAAPRPTADIQNWEYAQQNPAFADFLTGRGGPAEISLQPTWGIDQDTDSPTYGQMVLGQLGKDNKFHRTEMDGVQPIDPVSMAGEKKSATVDAETAAKARAALPSAEQTVQVTARAVQELRSNADGMREWFGQVGPRGVYVHPGTPMGNFVAATKQANAEAFMQARNMLKGGGQITDYEGRRGEDAFSRMQAALETGDQAAYLRALADFEEAVAIGFQKLQDAARGSYSAGSPAVSGGSDLKTKYGLE